MLVNVMCSHVRLQPWVSVCMVLAGTVIHLCFTVFMQGRTGSMIPDGGLSQGCSRVLAKHDILEHAKLHSRLLGEINVNTTYTQAHNIPN